MTREEYNKSKWLENHRVNEDGVIERLCSSCGNWIEESEQFFYYKNKSNKEKGFQGECKECGRVRSLKRKWENIEDVNRKHAIWYSARLQNDPEFREKHRQRAQKARDRGYYRNYYQRPEVKARDYSGKRMKNKKHLITDVEWTNCKEYFDNRCAYCGLPIEEHLVKYRGVLKLQDLHKEHVVENGKNDLSNCVPSCQVCNSRKNIKSLNNWYNINNISYTYERYYKIYIWLRYDYKKYIKQKKIKKNIK